MQTPFLDEEDLGTGVATYVVEGGERPATWHNAA